MKFIPIILVLPLISFLSGLVCSQILGKKGVVIVSLLALCSNVIIISLGLLSITGNNFEFHLITLGTWIQSGKLFVQWTFLFDRLNLIMLFVVNVVSLFVHLYSIEYMANDPHFTRFMSYISLFTFFMIILITGNNFVLLFLGWEGVGLCSYLLINFWYTRINANKSAMKALIINRVGDIGLTLAMIHIFYLTNTLDFSVFFALSSEISLKTVNIFGILDIYLMNLIGIFILIGAMGKSAQIGLHTWLPDAMEGPTPVSALIHAATMVTAGVFLIIKCSPFFENIPLVLNLMLFIGALTAFFSATIGLTQSDIKKVIAYSTCSQLGYMIFACGLSHYNVSFFHLANHAFFKALLFLTAGAIIHSIANEQDLRKFGSLGFLIPISSVTMTIGSLALAGTPFLSGFFSKDLILEISFSKYTIEGHFVYTIGLITAVMTTIYSYRIFILTFSNNTNLFKINSLKIHESPIAMVISLIFLSIGSIFFGFFTKEIFVGMGSNFWLQTIDISNLNNNIVDAEFIPQQYKLLPVFCGLFSVCLINLAAGVMGEKKPVVSHKNFIFFITNKIYALFVKKWNFDIFYNKFIAYPILKYSYLTTFKALDKGLIELLGPTGLSIYGYKIAWSYTSTNTPRQLRPYLWLFYIVLIIIFILFVF